MRGSTKKWVWLICLVLVISAVTVGVLLSQEPEVMLYWNVDGARYQHPDISDKSLRQPDGDGVYHILFAAGGQTVEYTTDDPQLVDRIDSLRVLSLTADSEGKIQTVTAADGVSQLLSDRDLVQQIEDGSLLVNSSIAFNGAQQTISLKKDCVVYDVAPGSSEPGAATQLQSMDEVLIYGNRRGHATHIFVLQRISDAKLYWRVDRSYSTKTKETSREPDENGVYTIPFAIDGQQCQLTCRDKDLVTQIDIPDTNHGAMGLSVDADGCITAVMDVYRAIRGTLACELYDITEVSDTGFAAVNKQTGDNLGKSYQGTFSPGCQIINVSDTAQFDGELTDQLLPGDRVTVYTDSMGVAQYIFVHVRKVDSPVYFNLERMYTSPDTTREPDADGWYVFKLLCDGELLTLKTQDRSVARQVDMYSAKAMGLKLNGDIIEDVYEVACVTGNSALVSGRYVFSLDGSILATKASSKGKQTAVVLASDCKIYDATGDPGTTLGEETTLQYWDQVNVFGDADGLATHVFVTKRAQEP